MLYSFHKDRNGKRPGSVHATYQIIGRRPSLRYSTNGAVQEDEDVEMEGNPFQSSMPETQEEEEETIPVTAFVLVQEEELEGMRFQKQRAIARVDMDLPPAAAKETFDEIETIFVYSIEPSHLQDIQLLSTCNADIRRKQRDEDPLESWKIYGGIRDPNCKVCFVVVIHGCIHRVPLLTSIRGELFVSHQLMPSRPLQHHRPAQQNPRFQNRQKKL